MQNFAIDKALVGIVNKFQSMTVPFFFKKGEREYMCRVKINMLGNNQQPTYQIYFFDITDQNTKLNDTFIFAQGSEELKTKVYEFYDSL